MKAVQIKAIVALVLMVAAFAVAQAWRPTAHLVDSRGKANLEGMFPKAFGDWAVDEGMPVQLIAPDTQAMLNKIYNQILSRTYLNRSTGERVMLSVAYGGDQADATRAHRPEVCYPAQGFQIIDDQRGATDSSEHQIKVRRLVAKLGGRVEPITYWIMVGDRIALSGTEQKLAQLSYTTRGVIPDGMLVRVSTIDSNAQKAYGVQDAFIAQMTRGMTPESRSRVVGTSGA